MKKNKLPEIKKLSFFLILGLLLLFPTVSYADLSGQMGKYDLINELFDNGGGASNQDNYSLHNSSFGQPTQGRYGQKQMAVPWWSLSYTKRRPITITAGDTVGVGYTINLVITSPLSSSIYSSCQASGNDLRIVYYDGSNIELSRDLITFSDAKIEVNFALKSMLNSGNADSGYYIYYCNSSAPAPVVNYNEIYRFYDQFDGIVKDTTVWEEYVF